jgi:hypothetical protein
MIWKSYQLYPKGHILLEVDSNGVRQKTTELLLEVKGYLLDEHGYNVCQV